MGCPDETTLSDFLVGLLPEARRQEVLAHVEGCAGCQRALAAGGDSTPAAGVPDVSAGEGNAPLARGATLSRYVVLERLGAGAMGVVYAAYDPELDRQVALKLLRPEGRPCGGAAAAAAARGPGAWRGSPTPTSSPSTTWARAETASSSPWSWWRAPRCATG